VPVCSWPSLTGPELPAGIAPRSFRSYGRRIDDAGLLRTAPNGDRTSVPKVPNLLVRDRQHPGSRQGDSWLSPHRNAA
jgi:hypothetical protein